jgi:serine/threonine-protein kinase HipA
MTERTLLASIDGQRIGTLHENQNIWGFEYDPAWRETPSGFALSPHVPLQEGNQIDGATTRPVQWYFDNLLPEEAARTLLARDANLPDINDAFALLEHYGRESAGSITLRIPGEKVDDDNSLRLLPDEELEARIRDLPNLPLTHDSPKKMSLAGAQHKLAVVLRDGQIFEPGGQSVSTHILKPNHPDNDAYPHSVINEWFIMRLARRVGLDVPEVTRRYVPTPVYLIERFDRVSRDGAMARRHAIDGCQLLNMAATMKYAGWSLDALAELIDRCRASAITRVRMFRWLVFCVIVGNGDSHLKNLSFLVGPDGITLAPHYDLLSEAVYDTGAFAKKVRWPGLSTFTRPVGTTERYIDFTHEVLVDAGAVLGLTRPLALRLLREMLRQIPAAADALIEEITQENEQILADRPSLAATFGGEMRLLRAIRHIVTGEMVSRLSDAA